MASHPRSIASQDYSVLTVSTNLTHSPFNHDCHERGNGAYSTEVLHEHSHHLSSQCSPANQAILMEQCSLNIVSGQISRDSSGFGGSIGHFDGTGTNPSPVFPSSFSPGFESPLLTYEAQHSSDHCSPPDKVVDHHSTPVARLHPLHALNQRPVPFPDTAQMGTLESASRQNGLVCSVAPQLAFSELRSTGLVSSFNKMNLRSRCPPNGNSIVCAVDAHNRSVPGVSHPSLEPIPQGQELSVHSHSATLSPDSSSTHHSCRRDAVSAESDGGSPLFNGSEKRKSQPCCSCRGDDLADGAVATRHIADFNGNPLVDYKSNRVTSKLKAEKNSDPPTPGIFMESVSHRSSDPSPRMDRSSQLGGIPGAHWARELIGRLRINSTHQPHPLHQNAHFHNSLDQPNLHHIQHSHRQRRHSAPRDANSQVLDPESIDPRRLPKAVGPTSAQLQFSKKPLHHVPTTSSSTSTPVPVVVSSGNSYVSGTGAASPALKSASWRPRKHIGRVRWVSQCTEDDVCRSNAEIILDSSYDPSQLSSSAVEEFRGAVDILAGRCQPFPSVANSTRLGVRVKRASESERLLVVSRSLSDSKEEFSGCSFGQFDENHVYGTLFRHSTCYDVLPDSGKLVILDSKLGVVRAIRALLENGVQAAPIWHATTQRVTGLFSQDFALHLLASLYNYGSTTDHRDHLANSPPCSSSPDAGAVDRPAHSSPTPQPTVSVTEGLKIWGSRRLNDILRLFCPSECACSSAEFADSSLIVPPQMGLQKALCRLVHKSHVHRLHGRRRSQSGSSDVVQNTIPNHQRKQELQKQQRVRSKPVRQDSMDLFDWEFASVGSNPESSSMELSRHRQRHSSDPHVRDRNGMGIRQNSGSPSANATSPSFHSGPAGSHTVSYSPTHLIVMNPDCGNVLGLVGVDRLLAYLRLRMDELPYSNPMMSAVGDLTSLRWSERSMVELPHSDTSGSSLVNCDPVPDIGQLPNPVLSPQTPCCEALRTLDLWLPQIPALPIVQSTLGATSVHANALLGFIAPGDLLHFVLGSESADVALDQPVGKILETKVQHCRFHQDCICYTEEPVVTVLDRMFRLRVTWLALFDSLTHMSSPHLVGMVTAKDLLQAIVTTDPHHRRHRHPRSSVHQHRHSGSSHLDGHSDEVPLSHQNEPMLLDDEQQAETDTSKMVDPCAHALGLTHSQHIRLQETQSDLLLGLSNPNSFSRSSTSSASSSTSLSSGSTFSPGCGSASEMDLESDRQGRNSSKADLDDSQSSRMNDDSENTDNAGTAGSVPPGFGSRAQHRRQRRTSSPSLSDRCSCACHQSGSSTRNQPTAHSAESVDASPVLTQSHSIKTDFAGHTNRYVPYPPKLDLLGSQKPSIWTMRSPHVPPNSLNSSRSPNFSSAAPTVPAPTVRIPIAGPPTVLETAYNTRRRRSETSSSEKVRKRDDDDSVFRMD